MDTNTLLFKELDKHSEKLRTIAKEIADFIADMPNTSPEIQQLCFALNDIYSVPIEKMDKAIKAAKDAYFMLDVKIKADKSLLALPHFMDLIDKNNMLVREAVFLETKAQELNKLCKE